MPLCLDVARRLEGIEGPYDFYYVVPWQWHGDEICSTEVKDVLLMEGIPTRHRSKPLLCSVYSSSISSTTHQSLLSNRTDTPSSTTQIPPVAMPCFEAGPTFLTLTTAVVSTVSMLLPVLSLS